MKSLPALCIRQSRLCIALGLLVASSTLVTVTSQAKETTQDVNRQKSSATRKRITRPAIRTARRRLRSKVMLTGFSDFVENKYKQITKRPRFHSTAQHRKSHTAVQQTAGGKSSVQRELEALYAKDGRQMPSMQIKDAPNTQSANHSGPPKQRAQRPVTVAPVAPKLVYRQPQPTRRAEPRRLQTESQTQHRHSSRRKSNFFQRLFGQKQKSHRQPYRYKPLPQQRVVHQHPAVQFPTRKKQAIAPPAPTRVRKPQVVQQIPVPVVKRPIAKTFSIPPAPEPEQIVVKEKKTIKQEAKLVNSETPVIQLKQTASNLENPFPEVSENEADGVQAVKKETSPKPTPFTGLTLNEKPSEKIISGLKGFCIVTLRDKRQLVDAKEEFRSTYQGKAYIFSSKAAQKTFENNPGLYAPVKGGQDTISLASAEEAEEGSLDFAVWYKGRLYLFSNQDNLQIFVQNPGNYRQTNTEK
ncbi:hypothetical protein MNBD_PLANCTO02-618 [hydrothermal vent metagenome]|uniref:YHS domain-containing protein n=1 Tax=hydrothermal vent metagenome TaxID=652676 RepID=A0A3B1D7A6_9ZZZZ